MHSRIAQVLNWQQSQSAVLSMRPSGNPVWEEKSLRMCAASHSPPPLQQRAPDVISLGLDPTWVSGPVMAVTVECTAGLVFTLRPMWKSLRLDSQVPQRAFTVLRLLVCFVNIICLAVVYLYTLSAGTSCFFSPWCQLSLHWAAAVEVTVHLWGAWKFILFCKAVIITVPDWCPLMGIQHLGRRQAQADAVLIPSQGASSFLARYT